MKDVIYTGNKLERQIGGIPRIIEQYGLSISKIETSANVQTYMAMSKSIYPPAYFVHTERITVPIVNVFLETGGEVKAIDARKVDDPIICSPSSEMKEIASILIGEDGALATLCMLASEGPQDAQAITKEVMPEKGVLRIISELSKCGLIEIVESKIRLTPRGENLMSRILTHSEE